AGGGRYILILPYQYAEVGKRSPSLWDIERGSFISSLGDAKTEAKFAVTRSGRLVAAASGSSVQIWDTETQSVRTPPLGDIGEVVALGFSENGRFLASCSKGGSARVFDVETGMVGETVAIADAVDMSSFNDPFVAVSNDGEELAVVAEFATYVWARRTQQ